MVDSDIVSRAELIQQAIATLQLSIQQIQASGEVAPPGCCVLRYQARGKNKLIGTINYTLPNQFFPQLNPTN